MSAPSIHAISTCIQCGIADDHPKCHIGQFTHADTYHHDCVPKPKVAEILAGGHGVHPLVTAKIFKLAEDGERGDDLRAQIMALEMRDFGDAKMLKYTTFANDVIDAYFPNGATGTEVIGATTYTLPFKVRWLSTLSVAGTPGTEWSGGGYPAGGISLAGNMATAAASASKANTAALTVTNAPATTWADNDVRDATATPKNVVFKGTPSLAKTVNAGDTASIAIGALTGSET